MRCFGPVYLDLFFFLTFLVQLSYVPFHTVHLQDSIFGYHTSTQTGLCVIRYVTCNLWRGITHYICFLFHTLTLLVRLAWILISPERLREREGGDSVWVCVCMCVCIYVFVCQIRPLEPVVHRELPLTNYICQSSRPMPIDARGGNKKIVAEVYKSVKSCLGHVGLLEILAVTQ